MTSTRTTRTARKIAVGAAALSLVMGLGSGVADAVDPSDSTESPLELALNLPVHPIDPNDPEIAIPVDPCPLGDCPNPDPEEPEDDPEDDPEHPEDDPEHPEDDGYDPVDEGTPAAEVATAVTAQPTFTG